MKVYRRILLCIATLSGLCLAATSATATELGDLCWLTAKGSLLRFSITQSGMNHYTYTGLFDDGDGISYALVGEVELVGATLEGTFSGSKTTSTYFRTGTWEVNFSSNLVGSVTGIRQTYNFPSGTASIPGGVYVDYQTTTVTPTNCQ